jgi:molybdopterin-guanine dinucleotide biosynthesis protein A
MGRDKAFVLIDGVPMVRRAADALTAAGCHPVVAIGGDADRLADIGFAVIADRWPGEGPVGGVLTALSARAAGADGSDVVVVVACDTPWLDAATVSSLLAALEQHPASVAAVAHTERIEPLCAAWRTAALPKVAEAFEAGERRLHRVLETMPVTTPISVVHVPAHVLRNVNAPGDVPG